ncbi:hypothetical protein M0804_002680 [Polistes exclamans]|nr:hypothetical protein M0804_002680 [Polistes exclamans]
MVQALCLENRDREKAAAAEEGEEEEGGRGKERGGWSRLVPIASAPENYRRVAWFSSTARHRSQLPASTR